MKNLRIAKELALPPDAVTQKFAWLGRTGSGKTFACKRMVEQMLRIGAQVVILDGAGVWAGLRLGPKAFKIPVLGGLYGDIPLESTGGALVADVIVDSGTGMVIDVSQMLDAERTRFATAFAQRFFQRKKAAPSAVHLVLEECQDYVPENHQRGEERMLHEFQRIAKQGRAFGIGLSLISQRPQEISKKALNQTECVLAFQMNGPQERKALEYWLTDKGLEEKLSQLLPRLEVGAPHVWSPQWLKISEVVHILPIDSLDTSSTPKVGKKATANKKLSPIDLKGLSAAMAETIERTRAEDPKELKRRIVELEKMAALAARKLPPSMIREAASKLVKGIVLGPFDVVVDRRHLEETISASEDLEAKVAAFEKSIQGIRIVANTTIAAVRRARATGPSALSKRLAKSPAPKDEVLLRRHPGGIVAPDKLPRPRPANGASNGAYERLPSGERVVLTAVAQHPDGVTREQLTILTGYKRSTRDAYVHRLGLAECVEQNGDRIQATAIGIARLGDFEPLPTGRALLEYWLRELPDGERRILEFVAGAYPQTVSRQSVDDFTGFKRSTRDAYLHRLDKRRLISAKNGDVMLSEELI